MINTSKKDATNFYMQCLCIFILKKKKTTHTSTKQTIQNTKEPSIKAFIHFNKSQKQVSKNYSFFPASGKSLILLPPFL